MNRTMHRRFDGRSLLTVPVLLTLGLVGAGEAMGRSCQQVVRRCRPVTTCCCRPVVCCEIAEADGGNEEAAIAASAPTAPVGTPPVAGATAPAKDAPTLDAPDRPIRSASDQSDGEPAPEPIPEPDTTTEPSPEPAAAPQSETSKQQFKPSRFDAIAKPKAGESAVTMPTDLDSLFDAAPSSDIPNNSPSEDHSAGIRSNDGATATSDAAKTDRAPTAMRTWVDNTGRFRTEGLLIKIQQDSVRILKANGRTCTVPKSRLGVGDALYVAELERANESVANQDD